MVRTSQTLLGIVLLLGIVVQCPSQEAVLKTRGTLRKDASSKHAPIMHVDAGTDVDLIDSALTNNYYHVRTSEGAEGWIYSRSIKLVTAAPAPAPAPTPTPGTPPTPPSGVSSAFSPDWEKPAPNQISFDGPDGQCGPTGDGGDAATNARKNRTDVPGNYHEVS